MAQPAGVGSGQGGGPLPPQQAIQQAQVPPGQLLREPIERPVQQVTREGQQLIVPSYGTKGRPFLAASNCFMVGITAPAQTVWYKYQVTILPTRQQTATNLPPPLPPKSLLRQIWRELEQRESNPVTSTGFWGGHIPVYDGRNACYAPRPLPQVMSTNIVLPGQGTRGFTVTITNPIPIQIDELRHWYSGSRLAAQADALDALAALNTLFHHGLALLYPASAKTFFIHDPLRHQIDARATRAGPGHAPHALDKGIELWRGFFESVRPCQSATGSGGLLLNVNTTTGAFIKSGNLVQFIMDFLPTQRVRDVYANALGGNDRINISRLIKGATVKIDLGRAQPPKFRKIRNGLTRTSASTTVFELREGDQSRQTTVQDYFETHFGVRLRDPDLPCVEVKAGVMYPIEICSIEPGTRSNRRLNAAQQLAATAYQTLAPTERFSTINRIRTNTISAITEPRLPPFQVRLAPRAAVVPARVLAPPTIAYSQGRTSQPDKGAWRMTKAQDRFVHGASCQSYAVILSRPQHSDRTYQFLQAFWTGARGLGMITPPTLLPPAAMHPWQMARGGHQSATEEAQTQVRLALDAAMRHYRVKPELVFFITDLANDPKYNVYKAAAAAEGVASQTLQTKGLTKSSDFQFLINVAMKVNGKLGGLNFAFVPGTTGGDKRKGRFEADNPLVLASDLTHVENKPSLASVVMSMDPMGLLYQAELSVQKLNEPLPNSPSTRGRKQEVVEEMEGMVFTLLKAFWRSNRTMPPAAVVMYRDGVSDSEWPAILVQEIPAVKRAFARFIAEVPECSLWKPKLTYILCVKRHGMRFFGQEREGREGRNDNLPAGAVIDRNVVDPRAFDWYGAAHTGILGTTRPTRYVVLEDEQTPRLSPDDVEGMTNALCHAYQRCNRAVSLPAPCYYADLICTRARAWMPLHADDAQSAAGTATSSEGDAQSRAADLTFFRDALGTAQAGLASFEAYYQKPPVMWWL